MPSLPGVLGLPATLVRTLEELAALAPRLPVALDAVIELRDEMRGLRSGIDEMSLDLKLGLENVSPMDEDLSRVETAVLGMAPELSSLSTQIDGLRSDLSRLPFVGKR